MSFNLPFGLGGVEFAPNEAEQRAAWALYVELKTRVAIQPLRPEGGLMRDVLTSLYSLFGLTRQVLREAGSEVVHGHDSLGPLAIKILIEGLAPFTTKWHHRLRAHELLCSEKFSPLEHEQSWQHFNQMKHELEIVQEEMRKIRRPVGRDRRSKIAPSDQAAG